MSVQAKHFYKFGPFYLDAVKRRLMRDGELVKLTPKAFETLLALVEQRGKTIEKDELLNKVWAGTAVEENNLNQSITALRKSLGDSREKSEYIATIPGVGYRFVAEVREVEAAADVVPEPIKADRRPMFRYALLILVPLVVAAVGYGLFSRKKSPPPTPAVSSIM
ncbi:MAG TPA: transcriptional regulator, partial [Pyrinomonadaceae bacterium]|nr:transcriptional regulator [Pyrinomonadaceae bacterium]